LQPWWVTRWGLPGFVAAPCPCVQTAGSSLWYRHCRFLGAVQELRVFLLPSAELCAVLNTLLEKLAWRTSFSLFYSLSLFRCLLSFVSENTLSCVKLLSLFRLWDGKDRDKMWHFHPFVFLLRFWLFTAETFAVLRAAVIPCGFVVRQANDNEAVKSVSVVCSV